MTLENPAGSSRVKNFPVNMFAVVMGLFGFTIMLYRAYHVQWLPKWPYVFMLFFSSAVFVWFLAVYAYKAVNYAKETAAELDHPVKINFFSAIPISFLLMSIAMYSFYPFVSAALWMAGVAGMLFMTFYTVNSWISRSLEIHSINPAWFIPIVGNLLVPIIGVDLAPYWFNAYFLFVGLFFWIVLFTVIFYRVIFHKQMDQKLLPTLFILIAPPAVAFIAYLRLLASVDVTLLFFIMTAYFFAVLLLSRSREFMKVKFFVSWWAYVFPLSAVSIASIIAYQAIGGYFKYAAWALMALDFFVLFIVAYHTVLNIYKKNICVSEEA
jgi:tellurite resistance protein